MITLTPFTMCSCFKGAIDWSLFIFWGKRRDQFSHCRPDYILREFLSFQSNGISKSCFLRPDSAGKIDDYLSLSKNPRALHVGPPFSLLYSKINMGKKRRNHRNFIGAQERKCGLFGFPLFHLPLQLTLT